MGNVTSRSKRKIWKSANICNVKGFLNISREVEITKTSQVPPYIAYSELKRAHAIPDLWECINSDNMETFCGKPYRSQAVGF